MFAVAVIIFLIIVVVQFLRAPNWKKEFKRKK